jgi:DNA (cytosine-5)-methyltransferase 1
MSGTLSCNNEQTLFEPYNICSMESNSMKSGNSASGIYSAETSRALDCNASNPSARQGGTVIAIQGNVLGRSDANGPAGIGFREDTAYTMNTVDNGGAVCYQETVGALCSSDYKGIRNQDISDDKAVVETFGNNGHGKWNTEPATLKASGGDHPGGENMVVENRYAVRRLTPLECLRLQGYPDFWLDDFHVAEPTEADIDYWYGVWEERRAGQVGQAQKP